MLRTPDDFILRDILPECRVLGALARDRLLAGLADIDEQALRLQDETFRRRTDKPPGHPEAFRAVMDAVRAGGKHYIALWHLRQTAVNLLATLTFHLFEQHESNYQQHVKALRRQPIDWKDHRWASALPSASVVLELRLVANASKHGAGPSAVELKRRRPDLFVNPVDAMLGEPPTDHAARAPFAGDGLYVKDDDLTRYQAAVESLWSEIAAIHKAKRPPRPDGR